MFDNEYGQIQVKEKFHMPAIQNRRVLVLNRSWVAVGIVTMPRAMTLLFSEYKPGEPKAKIIDPEDYQQYTWADWSALRPKEGEDVIFGTSKSFRVPKVIRLEKYDKIPNHKIAFSRRTIYKRDENTCQYCGKKCNTCDLSIDHINPKSRGGKTTWENCVLACIKCNTKKANRTPDEAKMTLIKKPNKPLVNFFKGDIYCKSWQNFLDAAYWSVELENDNPKQTWKPQEIFLSP